MNKKIRRILSMVLILMLFVSMIPSQAAAASSRDSDKIAQIKQEMKDLYKACQKASGNNSFHGYCGRLVSYQLYILGITDKYIGSHGKNHFDNYIGVEYSTGGYHVQTYPASGYTLMEALNQISADGTKDAYNIMVGFQRTTSVAGSKWGHSLLINAIIDGMVYYTESYSTRMNGVFYPEGSPIVCSIKDFVKYYDSYSTLDGLVHFGKKTYADSCEAFPAYLNASVTQETQLYTMPCISRVDESSKEVRTVKPGERILVTGLYRNTEGEYWYQVEERQIYYIRADRTQVLSMRYDDVVAEKVAAPAELRRGRGFNIKGRILSAYNEICTIRAQVFAYTDQSAEHVMSTTHTLQGRSYSLDGTSISRQLYFRNLEEGNYRYELAAVVGNYYVADGTLQAEWKTLKLWVSDFRVVTRQGGTYSVSFDANGGTASLNAADVAIGDSLPSMPEAFRDGYVLEGWYTQAGELVTEDTVISGNITLTAKWVNAKDMTGWYMEEGRWVYLENGVQKTGFVQTDGIIYHINAEGYLDVDWVQIDGKTYYFNGNGAMHLGWLDTQAGRYYFTVNGAYIGWLNIDYNRYYFNSNGIMLTGAVEIDGVGYYFDENGVLQS